MTETFPSSDFDTGLGLSTTQVLTCCNNMFVSLFLGYFYVTHFHFHNKTDKTHLIHFVMHK